MWQRKLGKAAKPALPPHIGNQQGQSKHRHLNLTYLKLRAGVSTFNSYYKYTMSNIY